MAETSPAVPQPTVATGLPGLEPVRLLGTPAAEGADPELALELYRWLVLGRRFNQQATALTKQGRLAVYPSSVGQEACQVAAALALRTQDWLFPTYRDTLAVTARGVDPVETLTLLRGDWHCGYDPVANRVAPLCTPLATQCPHAVGLAHAAQLLGQDTVALALVGDGGTSEGDFHEAVNFAGVLRAPVVFLVQNNGYAISVPLHRQCAAPSLAHKGIGYGVAAVRVDGNDAFAVHAVLSAAVERARSGGGPTLVEALTYRIEPHTNADDATRYRFDDEVAHWRRRDPVALLATHLTEARLLTEPVRERIDAEAEAMVTDLRTRLGSTPMVEPADLFQHVFAEPTDQQLAQRRRLEAELAAEAATSNGSGAPV